MQTIYIEKNILSHPRVKRILNQFDVNSQIIECDYYKEVFNPKSQNFRIQKQNPALILAEKHDSRVLATPPGFGVGGEKNYYFSHMLNCLYDCRYCFLQGMYSSANYVLFINYEEFMHDIKHIDDTANSPNYFFSGYDCDSLAYEPVSHFLKEFLPFFASLNNSVLELRTKSTNVKELLNHKSFKHCIVAFSFTPDEISQLVEHKVPSITKRLSAMKAVADHGWQIGLRFDPLIYHPEFETIYQKLIDDIFKSISNDCLHSISIGPLRFPDKMYQKIIKLHPNDKLLTHPFYRRGNVFSYKSELENAMKSCVKRLLENYVDETLLFECKTCEN